MPIFLAPSGKELTIKKILTDEKTKRHLNNLGLLVGSIVTIVSSSPSAVVLQVKEGRVALGKDLLGKIIVA